MVTELSGKRVSDFVKEELINEVKRMSYNGKQVCLVVIQVGSDAASSVYVNNKQKACDYVGINSFVYNVNENVSQEAIINIIDNLNNDDTVNGILVQLPLPKHLNESEILSRISPSKDVDGFHEYNVGRLMLGKDGVAACTPSGIIKILEHYNIKIASKNCVVVGRSNIVGKPMAMMLLKEDGTVTICHSKTENLKEICKTADILVCAIGKPKFFNHEYIKDGAVVIDVGIHKLDDGTMCGDVDFDDVVDIVSAITPVPGGVGPMTVAMLMSNCVKAAKLQYANKQNAKE